MYTFSIKLSFSSIGQENPRLQKQISKLLILIETNLDANDNVTEIFLCINVPYLI